MAQRFDQIHSVERAKEVGSIHDIISPKKLRPYLIEAIGEGMAKVQDSMPKKVMDQVDK